MHAAQDSTFPLLVKFMRSIWRWHWYPANKDDAKAAGRYLQKRMRANGKRRTEELSCKYITRHKYQKCMLVARGWFRRKIRITSSSLFNPLNKPKLHQDQRRQVPVTGNAAWSPVFSPIPMPAISSISWKIQKRLCCFSGQAWCLSCEHLWNSRGVPLKLRTSSSLRDIKMNRKSELWTGENLSFVLIVETNMRSKLHNQSSEDLKTLQAGSTINSGQM